MTWSAPGPGRDTACTPELTEVICGLLRQGIPIYIAAQCQGINRGTLHRWLANPSGEAQERFRDRVKCEVAEGHKVLLQGILTAQDWRGLAWVLERTAPADFAPPPARTEIGPPGAFDRSAPDAEVEAQLAEAQAVLALPPAEVDDAED